jgi:hypothetical protein
VVTIATSDKRHLTCDEIHKLLGIPSPRNYADFLKSKYWHDCKQRILERDQVCTQCGSDQALEVHHTTYEHHRDELNHLTDLVTLCNECHSATHDKTSRRKGGLEPISAVMIRSYLIGTEQGGQS